MDNTSDRPRRSFIFTIGTHEEAGRVIQHSSLAFMVVALIGSVTAVFSLSYARLAAALIIGLLAIALRRYKSRAVALLLLIIFSSLIFPILGNLFRSFTGLSNGAADIFFSLIIIFAAVKAVEATFKLDGGQLPHEDGQDI